MAQPSTLSITQHVIIIRIIGLVVVVVVEAVEVAVVLVFVTEKRSLDNINGNNDKK
jgi:hypothetical protein